MFLLYYFIYLKIILSIGIVISIVDNYRVRTVLRELRESFFNLDGKVRRRKGCEIIIICYIKL